LSDDFLNGRAKIVQHFDGREANDPNALPGKPPIPANVVGGIITHNMSFAIHLDREPRCRTVEIENVWAQGMLPAKLMAIGSLAKLLPQKAFGQSRRTTQTLRPDDRLILVDDHRQLPLHHLRWSPSPDKLGRNPGDEGGTAVETSGAVFSDNPAS
jgi:hypothetical protein